MRARLALIACLLLAVPASAQTPRANSSPLIRAAALVQEIEGLIQAREARLAVLSAELAEKEASLDQSRAELGEIVGAMHRLARRPRELALMAADHPREAVHRAQLLAAAWSAIEARAGYLRAEIDAVEQLSIMRAEEQRALGSSLSQLAAERAALDSLLSARPSAQARISRETADRLARLAREAGDLRDFIQRLEASSAPPRPTPRPAVASARATPPRAEEPVFAGLTRLPAVGRTILGFGAPGAGGTPHRGILIAVNPGSTVVAPAGGRIAFAGPFRGYGLILIIDHGEGYHTLLMGLGRIDAATGQWVDAGEPVGGATGGEDSPPNLYVELRRHGQPIDPLPWLVARKEKENG